MLNLTRKIGETIVIGDDIRITVVRISGNQVELLTDAPKHIPVHRLEIYERIKRQEKYLEVRCAGDEYSDGSIYTTKENSHLHKIFKGA